MGFSLIGRLVMPLPELENYYLERRKKRFEQGKELKHIRLRETLYPFFILFLTGDRLFRRQKVTVLGGHKPDKEQVIYACTHIGENDLENIYESLRRGCWWFVGDPCVLYKDLVSERQYFSGTYGQRRSPYCLFSLNRTAERRRLSDDFPGRRQKW